MHAASIESSISKTDLYNLLLYNSPPFGLTRYVFPGKKILCNILKISGNRIHLYLRRVKQNEKKLLLDKIKKEKNS